MGTGGSTHGIENVCCVHKSLSQSQSCPHDDVSGEKFLRNFEEMMSKIKEHINYTIYKWMQNVASECTSDSIEK